MDNKINFEYHFVSDKGIISNKDKRDVPAILAVDATFSIKINNKLYFETELAILEFYKSLYEWKEKMTKDYIPEFHYYTIEYDDYEDGAILSLLPFSNQARLESIWAESDIYNVFDLNYIVGAFIALEKNLRDDIEEYYEIKLKNFIKHIPYR
ncbi:hypothetical protein [Virgibacillus pantothenticus]|uniref:DUF7878 domain-containing protein n=1 Tax=Virgibacillus pantothenticus TaxID=1473 RepID=A0A0L0QU99_VIRPA|nr:hypothetical protein [Virgibacillus pantothenticus]KNE22265.1 hypothetical protein AFK71_01075 [Virgibacillus pantothenticus]MED3739028.1 hypothetical protein [Virgibacillus pantothenticus]QTY16717.1 hypothetical protein KBP50_01875 [Virgibacillus pantothenticus]SIS88227.1 hypothetical protein SAMN05421787_105239 [Virgibacillus pantothenticus]